MEYINYYINVFAEHYLDYEGRARRTEYWSFTIISAIVAYLLSLLSNLLPFMRFVAIIYGIAVIIPEWTIAIRRLHDTEHSGWWIFISLVPVIGWIWELVLLCKDGMPCPNRYGANPKHKNPPKYL